MFKVGELYVYESAIGLSGWTDKSMTEWSRLNLYKGDHFIVTEQTDQLAKIIATCNGKVFWVNRRYLSMRSRLIHE